jgi:uncharacterized protein (TIGR03083 family)
MLIATVREALAGVVGRLSEDDAWTPTGCTGWVVRDLVFHLHADALRALVAAHTPAGSAADCDAVDYWRAWGSDPEENERNRRLTRAEAGLQGWPALRDRYLEASAASVRAVGDLPDDAVLRTQGHAITAADLASTLAVEATLHHADLCAHLDVPGPTAEGLAEVRRVVEALADRSLPGWSDERVALVGTGRLEPSDAELAALSGARVPVFT